MKISSWNIRGFNMPLKQIGLRSFMKMQHVDIMGVLETKLNHGKLSQVLRFKFKDWE